MLIPFFRWEEESTKENKPKDKEEQADKSLTSRDNINILLESNRENLYSNLDTVGGLGFRASLPKMPSFRRKKIPSPVLEDEDESQKASDSEEIVHDSDFEVPQPIPRERKDSTSSSSSSSSFSSSSDSDSSDESSSDSETEVKQINRHSPNLDQKEKMETAIKEPSPLRDGIEARNKTPEPMQVIISI